MGEVLQIRDYERRPTAAQIERRLMGRYEAAKAGQAGASETIDPPCDVTFHDGVVTVSVTVRPDYPEIVA